MMVAGIDVGSLSTDAVILRNRQVTGSSIIRTGADPKAAAERALDEALTMAGEKRERLCFVVGTGYGRFSIPLAHRQITEITCHALGAHYMHPETRTVIDIGGQDSKVIRINGRGEVDDFMMNDKCAAGTGRFLEVMAQVLEVQMEDMGALGAGSTKQVSISSTCTVFAESEVVSLIAAGHAKEDIISSLHEAVAERVAGLALRIGVRETVAMTGGVAKNRGIVKALEGKLGTTIVVPPEPQLVGALGAALLAHEQALRS
ncbi:2-hydroxyglutaryl-CoA dehydratase [Clostridiales bacterium PH28_bin88]|nr:2-hydroxyglutaryl-CoA dehydratase [Clostridiales bacterium PH28_bin88]